MVCQINKYLTKNKIVYILIKENRIGNSVGEATAGIRIAAAE